jgi:hypothetical protein
MTVAEYKAGNNPWELIDQIEQDVDLLVQVGLEEDGRGMRCDLETGSEDVHKTVTTWLIGNRIIAEEAVVGKGADGRGEYRHLVDLDMEHGELTRVGKSENGNGKRRVNVHTPRFTGNDAVLLRQLHTTLRDVFVRRVMNEGDFRFEPQKLQDS